MCSKGCNQLIKIDKSGTTFGSNNAQSDGSLLAVCQADKRIVCEGSTHSSLREAATQSTRQCTQEKEVLLRVLSHNATPATQPIIGALRCRWFQSPCATSPSACGI